MKESSTTKSAVKNSVSATTRPRRQGRRGLFTCLVLLPASRPGTGAGRGGHGAPRGTGARGGEPSGGRPGQGQARPGSAVAGPSRRARGRGPGQAPPGSELTPGCPGHHGHAQASTIVSPHAHRSLGSGHWGAWGGAAAPPLSQDGLWPRPWAIVVS